MSVVRFGVSLETEIMSELDEYVNVNRFPNRSQAIRSLVEKYGVEKKWQCDNEVAGAIVVVYNHHKRDINTKLNDIQHHHQPLILSVQHVHLDHENCLETIAVKGKAKELTQLADKIITLKGVHHGKLVMTRT
ncbi:MAG: nickel-responsive transcriptional regulator NikR [Bacteroidales bacterium]|nr:nickel-responsive transcriptional regulator NikR [Bacteroidales bacterium]MBN2764504.1 nickel-responsive transcriptional regulator NikR [Bacteroidales bacterium]